METPKDYMIQKLLGFISNPLKVLDKNIISIHLSHGFKSCLEYCIDFDIKTQIIQENKLFVINSVLDYLHDDLNTGHWSEISIDLRHNFTVASYLKTLLLLQSCPNLSLGVFKACLKCLDLGLLLGAPLEENPDLLSASAKYLRININNIQRGGESEIKLSLLRPFKRKLIYEDNLEDKFKTISGEIINELDIPSIETFNKKYFIPQLPVKLTGCMTNWPARTKWQDLNYLLKIAGDRTVPVEIGIHYTDEDWSQQLMTLKEFIKNHYLSDSVNTGYLAQHNLFNQISELQEDIRVPEYCCCSLNYENATEPDINAWLGPKGTVSPLHQDPKNNILTQVYGTKQILLIPPKDTEYVYPHEEKMLSNTAQVNPLKPDMKKFPNFKKSKVYKCLLEPGEMLFIPVEWWHHVIALEKSFSVSFWWQ